MQDSDIKMFLSQEQSDDTTNGGRASTTEVATGVAQNVWPHVNKALRDAGNEPNGQYRKVHIGNRNSANEPGLNFALIYDGDTLGADRAFFFPVSHDAEQSDWVSGGEIPTRKYVSGDLDSDVISTDTELDIVFANADQTTHVKDGDKLYLTNQTTPGGAGDVAEVTVTGTPSIASLVVTCQLTGQIGTNFLASNTRVCVMYPLSTDLEPSIGTQTNSIAGTGTLDDTQITLDNNGTIRQDVTLTFTSTTAFNVTSDEPGVTLASGTIGSQYSPINPNNSKPYLTIPVAAWTDTDFAASDWIKLPLNPANIPQVQQRIIPSSCPSLANNRLRVVATGESET